jgi:hypothetical protein
MSAHVSIPSLNGGGSFPFIDQGQWVTHAVQNTPIKAGWFLSCCVNSVWNVLRYKCNPRVEGVTIQVQS